VSLNTLLTVPDRVVDRLYLHQRAGRSESLSCRDGGAGQKAQGERWRRLPVGIVAFASVALGAAGDAGQQAADAGDRLPTREPT
jgi:hypothetical protein